MTRTNSTRLCIRGFLLFCVVIGAIGLRVHYGRPLCEPDEFSYIAAAQDANDNGWGNHAASIANIYTNRFSLTLPVALFMKIFGVTEQAVVACCLLFSVSTIVCTFLLGMVIHSYRVGLISAVIVSLIPQDIWYSLVVSPDNFIPFYIGVSLLCFATALRWPGSRVREYSLYVASGLFAFFAFEARATSGIVLLPLVATALCSRKRNPRAVLVPSVTFFGALASLWSLLFALSGDFLLQYRLLVHDAVGTRWTATGKLFEHTLNTMPVLKVFGDFPGFLAEMSTLDVWRIWPQFLNFNVGLLFYLAWPAFAFCLWMAIKRDDRYWLPVLSFGLMYLFFEFASTSFTSYQPIWKYDRFLTICSVPSAILIAMMIENIGKADWCGLSGNWRWGLAFTLVGLYTAVSCLFLWFVYWSPLFEDVDVYRQTVQKLKHMDSRPVYVTHWPWSLRGGVFARFRPKEDMEFKSLKNVPVKSIRRSVVILDKSFFEEFGEYQISWDDFDPALKRIPEKIPAGWKLLFTKHRPRPFDDPTKTTEVFVLEVEE